MAAESNMSGDYFDTPARAERLQLLLHLVRNAGEVLYLRAPSGAGKTRFAHQLLDILGDEVATVWLAADHDSDIAAVAVDQLGLSPNEVRPWPDAVMTALAGQDLLLIVDDADRLGLEAVESLALLHARGGRLLLVGQGGLAHTNGNWDVQFVDLPAFDARQTVAFLRTQAGEHTARVTDDLAAGLHRAANGLPGPLLDALNGVLSSARTVRRAQQPAAPLLDGSRRPLWPWAFGGLILILLLSVLLFQDRINALFSPPLELDQAPPQVVVEPAGAPDPASDNDPVAAENLRAEAVSALMPEISLPQLSPESERPEAGAMEPEVTTSEMVESTDSAKRDPIAEPAPAIDGDIDPLDAVMLDALAAAEAGSRPDAMASKSPSEAASAPAEKRSTEAGSSKSGPAVDPAAVDSETKKEALVEATPKTPPLPEKKEPAAKKTVAPEPAATEVVATPPPVKEPVVDDPRGVPAPVESRRAAGAKSAVKKSQPAKVVSQGEAGGGSKWLKSRAPGHYTLQLVGARDRAAVQKFVRDFGIKAPYAIFERDLKGRPWYSLVAGDYPHRDAAIAARGQLPKRLERSGVWPRTFESINK